MGHKILPPKLEKNKKIGVIAPADPVRNICSEDVIQRGYKYLSSKGFTVEEGESVKIKTKKHIAGPISLRINDIHKFVKRKDIGAIMAFWGGFNSNQLLDHLNYDLIKKNPKIFIGYSDVTALTTAITKKTGLITFSGPGVISFAKPDPFDYTWDYFKKTCIDPVSQIAIKPSPTYADDQYFLREDDNHRIKKDNEGIKVFNESKAEGEIVAGHLQTLLLLNDTEYFPDLNGKIIFVEEDESSTPAHVDRFLCQCKQLGWFEKVNGVVFGRFTEQSKFSTKNSFKNLLQKYLSHASFPVLYNVDFGHSDPMITIPNGGICKINNKQIIFSKSVSE